MTEAEIKIKRTESLLLELIPEALGALNDKRLHLLNVVAVKCSRGRSDAKIFIDPQEYTLQEQAEFIKLLVKARPLVEEFCLKDQGWFKSPKLTFEFDKQFVHSQRMEDLFKQIEKK